VFCGKSLRGFLIRSGLDLKVRLEDLHMLNVPVLIVLIIELARHYWVALFLFSCDFGPLFQLFGLVLKELSGKDGLARDGLSLNRASALGTN
jgi:hypothetical protein